MNAVTDITVHHTILTGNLGDMGLDVDDCNRIAALAEAAIAARLEEEYPDVPRRIISDVQSAAGVGGGIGVTMLEHDADLGFDIPSREENGWVHVLTELCNDVTEAYMEFKAYAKAGLYTVDGKRYALTRDAELTNRLFCDGHVNFNDVADGETYDEEWSAPAVDEAGNAFEVFWIFENTKGEGGVESPEDFPWGNVDRVKPR